MRNQYTAIVTNLTRFALLFPDEQERLDQLGVTIAHLCSLLVPAVVELQKQQGPLILMRNFTGTDQINITWSTPSKTVFVAATHFGVELSRWFTGEPPYYEEDLSKCLRWLQES